MTHRLTIAIALTVLLLVVGCETTETQIAADDVPPKVMAGFKKAFPEARLLLVEQERYKDGTVHYEFEFRIHEGEKMEAEFNTEGVLITSH